MSLKQHSLGWSWKETKRNTRMRALCSAIAEGDPHSRLRRRHGGQEAWTQTLEVARAPSMQALHPKPGVHFY